MKGKGHALAEAAAQIAAGKQAGDRAVLASEVNIEQPVPEQRAGFTPKPVTVRTDKGQVAGRAYRRQPYFETLAKLPADRECPDGARLITAQQLRGLRRYRDAWEAVQHSETRCALDMSSGGGGGGGSRVPPTVVSSRLVDQCDRAMGAIGDTMRAVALQDQSFAQVAIVRWGGRDRQRVQLGKGKQKPRIVKEVAPRSNGHVDIVRDEFLRALAILTSEVEAAGAIG